MIVSRHELAEVLGISPAKISSLQNSGVFTPMSRGKYNLTECVQKFIEVSVEYLMKKKMPKLEDMPQENLQYWKMVRQKNAALRELGVTMKLDDAERLMSGRLEQIRNVLTSIDSVWAPYMVGLKTVEDSQKMLAKQLDILFEQLSSLQDFEPDVEDVPSDEEIDEQMEADDTTPDMETKDE
jgi:nitrogen-specific signal transduction histidine kinase